MSNAFLLNSGRWLANRKAKDMHAVRHVTGWKARARMMDTIRPTDTVDEILFHDP
jgi:hypothetical protein